MLFSSTTFLYLFFPIVLFFNFIVFRKIRALQNIFLLLSSLFFYAWGNPPIVLIMIASIVVNWFCGLIISKKTKYSKLTLVLDIIFNLAILFVFKYLMFTCEIINTVTHANIIVPDIALPIGISFFTFQAMSYVIDVYRRKGEVQTNILYVGLYISFFPQLVAGPIVRYETVADQIQNRRETLNDFLEGFSRFVIGLSKKVLLANPLAFIADNAFNSLSGGSVISILFSWVGIIAYTLQIFFDFSGYSDMAIGLGRMFGFHFLENFDYPYISTSITEFWRRWHISMGSWFRDYLYIPLGGSRCSKKRNLFNLFVVWLCTGIWHGANYTFIIWGMMYFALLVFERTTGFCKSNKNIIKIFRWVYTIFFVIIGWVFFRANSVGDALLYLKTMFGLNNNVFIDKVVIDYLAQNIVVIIIGVVLCTPVVKILSTKLKKYQLFNYASVCGLICLFALSLSSIISSTYNPFIYFNF